MKKSLKTKNYCVVKTAYSIIGLDNLKMEYVRYNWLFKKTLRADTYYSIDMSPSEAIEHISNFIKLSEERRGECDGIIVNRCDIALIHNMRNSKLFEKYQIIPDTI